MLNTQNTYHQDFLFQNNNNTNNNNIVRSIPQQSNFNRTFVKPRNTKSDNYDIGSLLNKDKYSNNNVNTPFNYINHKALHFQIFISLHSIYITNYNQIKIISHQHKHHQHLLL